MFRRVARWLYLSSDRSPPLPYGKRVGIWPLHLDPPTLEHGKIVDDLLSMPALGLDRVILLPATHFSVSINYSLHIAAMAQLAMRDKSNVEVDFAALEKPSTGMPRLNQLIRLYGVENSVLIHWLPDVTHLKDYDGALSPPSVMDGDIIQAPPDGTMDFSRSITSHSGVRFASDSPLNHSKTSQGFLHDVLTVLLRPHAARGPEHYATHLPAKRMVVPVAKVQGGEVRRMLHEGEVDARTLIPPAVLQYAESHGLYRDFRRRQKYFYGTQYSNRAAARLSHSVAVGGSVAFEGIVPRLELVYDERNVLAKEIRKKLLPFAVKRGEHPDLIVPIGGDGFMMHCIRKHWQRFIPFYGVNAGHVGYLLNDAAHLEELLGAPLTLYNTAMLHVTAWSYVESDPEARAKLPKEERLLKRSEDLAFNDAWVERHSGQTALLNVNVNGVQRLRAVRGDAILVATAAGSTAYAQALGGSPLPIGAPMLQLVGSNCVHPARWKPVHLNSDAIVELEALSTTKRPCNCFTDGVDLGPVKRVVVRSSRVAGVQLAFSQSCDLQSKLYKLQFPKT